MAVKASVPLEKLKEQLTCVVCLDFYTNPKTLPCLHSFCLRCLEGLPLDLQGDTYYIACPTCRHRTQLPSETEGIAGFPTAFHVNKLTDTYTLMNEVSDPQVPQQLSTCRHHGKHLEIFCETCNQVICLHCTNQNHKDHDWNLITESYLKHCQELKENLGKVNEKVRDVENILTAIADRQNEIVKQREVVKEEILVVAEEIIKAIRESASQLTRKVETVTNDKLQVLSEQKKLAEMGLGHLKSCEEYVEQTIAMSSQQQLLMSKKQVMEHMIQVTRQINVEEFNPIEKADIQFIGDNNVVTKAHHIGDIVFTSLKQCKVKEITKVERISRKEVSFPLLLEYPDTSLLFVPALSIECSLVPVSKGQVTQPITATVTSTTHPGVYNVYCNPITNGHHQFNLQTHNVQLEDSSLIIPFTPYLKTITPVCTISYVNCPWGVAVSDDGNHIVVSENKNNCVTILDREHKKVKSFGGEGGSGKVKFTQPRGVKFTPDNFILVTDNHRIQKINMDGKCIASIGKEGNKPLQFDTPRGLVISHVTGQIYIADTYNHRIQVLTHKLRFSHSFGNEGSVEGQFKKPYDIAINSMGLLYVTDKYNHRVQVFTADRQFVTQFGTKGSSPGQLIYPLGITIDKSTDLVYVSEEGNHCISIFTGEGQFVNRYSMEGNSEWQYDIPTTATGITVDKQGVLYICDIINNKLVIY